MTKTGLSRRAGALARFASMTLLLCAGGGASQLGAQTQLVIVSGIGGAPRYTQAFGEWSSALARAAHERFAIADSAILWFGESGAPRSRWYRGVSTRENVERALAQLADQGPASEQVIVVLLGHGAGEGTDTRISIPGPDMTAADFARLLTRFGQRRVAFLNLTSASGDMLPLLSAPTRVIVTATKSAFERNESQFARYFVAALAADGADTDKDGRVSLLEAFRYAEAETRRFYESESRLVTEHPQISDEGQLARRFFLDAGPHPASVAAGGDASLAALYAEKTALDEEIESLKRRKATMSAESYDAELERLLLALAETSREIRRLEGK